MKRATQEIIYETRTHEVYPPWHEPLHKVKDCCPGCGARRKRQNRNRAAGRQVGVSLREDQPAGACKICKVEAYAGVAENGVPIWAWNRDIDRQGWGIEPRDTKKAPTFCPVCRPKE